MKRNAFTILELLVVISVLVILIGIAIPQFKGMKDAGTIAKVKGELRTLVAATESYKIMNNSYPTATSNTTTAQTDYLVSASPQIISTALYDPFVDGGITEYRYKSTAASDYYVWFSVGPNGTFESAGGRTPNISSTGVVVRSGDDICITNGTGC